MLYILIIFFIISNDLLLSGLKSTFLNLGTELNAFEIDVEFCCNQVNFVLKLGVMLGLHYVPGSHDSQGSQKRSSPRCF